MSSGLGTVAVLMYGCVVDRDSTGIPPDFPEQATRILLASAGFTQVTTGGDDYWARRNRAKRDAGVTVVVYGSREHPLFALAARVVIAYEYAAVFAAGEDVFYASGDQLAAWDTALGTAVKLLGVTPDSPEPTWRLCSYTGAHDDPWRPFEYPWDTGTCRPAEKETAPGGTGQ